MCTETNAALRGAAHLGNALRLNCTCVIIIDDYIFTKPHSIIGSVWNPNYWGIHPGSFAADFPALYNQTAVIIQSNFGIDGWYFTFDGTSVSLYGITPPSSFNQTIAWSAFPFNIQSDLSSANAATFPLSEYAQAAFGGFLYETPTLSTGSSTIEVGLTGASGILIDYATATVGDGTSLAGQRIIVDDTSIEIFWNGTWSPKTDLVLDVSCTLPFDPMFNRNETTSFTAGMHPHANSTHRSGTVGDSFVFQFSGTTILASGITPGNNTANNDWLLAMNFTLYDGNSTVPSSSWLTNFTSDSDFTDATRPHYVYFSMEGLSDGDHTLFAQILAVSGNPPPQAQIDYITYLPSFATASQKPTFNPGAFVAALDGGGIPPAGTSASGQAMTSSASITASAAQQSMSAAGNSSKSHAEAGPIAGGVISGLVFVLVLVATVLFYIRRKRTGQRAASESYTISTSLQPAPLRVASPTSFASAAGESTTEQGRSWSGNSVGQSRHSSVPGSRAIGADPRGRLSRSDAALQPQIRELPTQDAWFAQQLQHRSAVTISAPPEYSREPQPETSDVSADGIRGRDEAK
ncbi:hypothetical protein HMN09_00881400 [Mycena chlorophos]|uniref:Uncharacterized protein n=1 Tax=Mycena chlorophos TaxID=658473 RepID=A0A8H6SMR1_MYCCL|nr:hypothetical protein HMN09_00881400 [Mycena chlorophos]